MMFVTNPSSDFVILALYPVKGFESDFAPCLASLSTRLTNLSFTCSFFFWTLPFFSSIFSFSIFFNYINQFLFFLLGFQSMQLLFFVSGLFAAQFFEKLWIYGFNFFQYRFYSLSYQTNGSRNGNVCYHMRGIS